MLFPQGDISIPLAFLCFPGGPDTPADLAHATKLTKRIPDGSGVTRLCKSESQGFQIAAVKNVNVRGWRLYELRMQMGRYRSVGTADEAL